MSGAVMLAPGVRVGAYRIERLLGRGAFKAVWAATNLEPDSNGFPATVAIASPLFQDEEARALLENEFRVVSTLHHPSIAAEYALEEHDGQLFIVMELVEGAALNRRLRAQGPLPLQEAVEIVRQIGEALDYAHEGLTIHRDVKPANIILRSDGKVKVLDFGLARLMSHSKAKATSRVGSVAYMAPEQFEGGAGLNADLWALGVTFYQLITNVLPFGGSADEASLVRGILYGEPDLDPIGDGAFDRRLVQVVRKILEKDPEKRYQTAAEFVADLAAVVRRGATTGSTEGALEVLLRAHYPLVWIQSFEEERVLASLRRVRESLSVERRSEFYVWSETRGLCADGSRPIAAGTAGDPTQALWHVARGDEEGIYVFLDMHRHFTPVTVRLVRDAVMTVKRRRKSLVFVTPVLDVPKELEADVTLFFYQPPELRELREVIEALAAEGSGGGSAAVVPRGPTDETVDHLARACLGLTAHEAERVLRRAALNHGGLDEGSVAVVTIEKEQIVRKAGLLEFRRTDVGFEDVGGLDRLKNWFAQRRRAFGPEGRRFGLRVPRGVVLVGVPGCGKSLSAKALAKDWGVPLLRMDVGRLRGKFVGQSEANVRRALATAEHVSPCVLWVDELEKAFAGLGGSGDSGVTQRMFGTFLTWLEEHEAPVFVAATANDASRLPMELTRGGRFDERFFIDLPGADERRAIVRIHLGKRGRSPDRFDIEQLTRATDGLTGAEIEEGVVTALYRCFDDGERELVTEDLLWAFGPEEMVPLAKSRRRDLDRMRAWASANARPAQG